MLGHELQCTLQDEAVLECSEHHIVMNIRLYSWIVFALKRRPDACKPRNSAILNVHFLTCRDPSNHHPQAEPPPL